MAPSDKPSKSSQPSLKPSLQPTQIPSNIPSKSYSPTQSGARTFYWGNSQSFGQSNNNGKNVQYTTPQLFTNNFISDNVIDISSGSKYSILLMKNCTAYSGGCIELEEKYQGHLGLGGDSVVSQGINNFKRIANVIKKITTDGTMSYTIITMAAPINGMRNMLTLCGHID